MRFANNKYILYSKDDPVISFRCDRNSDDNPVFIQEQEFSTKKPFCFQDINTWIENRRAPKHRKHIKELLEKCGCDDLEGFIRFAYCAGLNDTFWIKPEELDIKWDDISLYKNRFDENIARLAFGTGLMGEGFTSTTPELATDGTFAKCWKQFNDGIYLLKQGSFGTSNAGKEPYSELYAYELSKNICSNALPYTLMRFHGELVSKCRLFTSEKTGYTPALSFFNKQTNIEQMIKYFEEIGSGNEFRQMMVLDALTLNTDRHLKNFGFLYDNDTMEIKGMAPVFDNNLSLCPFATIEDLKNIEEYMATRQCAIGEGFNENAFKCLTPDIKTQLEALRTFTFDDNSYIKLPEERLQLLENMIHKQVENLLHERIINIPLNIHDDIVLTGFYITIDKKNISDVILNELKHQNIKLNDFDITTASGDMMHVKDCEYSVIEDNGYIYIDVYDCKIEDNSADLKIKEICGLSLQGNNPPIPTLEIEMQLNKGDFSKISTITNYNINFTDNPEHIIVNDIINIQGVNKDVSSLNEQIDSSLEKCNANEKSIEAEANKMLKDRKNDR